VQSDPGGPPNAQVIGADLLQIRYGEPVEIRTPRPTDFVGALPPNDPGRRGVRDDRSISGGRLIASFPVGTPMDTCFAYGQNPSMLRERYYEAHDFVKRAWTEEETFAFNGRFN
jgi:hypothetical protein